jgi:signal transduction histidine kinase
MLVPMLAIMGLTLGLVSLVQAYLAAASLARQQRAQQARIVQTLSRANFPLDGNVLRQAAALIGAELAVTDGSGRVLAASDPRLPLWLPHAREAGPPMPAPGGGAASPWYHAALPLDRRAVGGELWTLHLAYDRQTWDQARWRAVAPPLVVGGAGLAMVAIAAGLIASHVTQPIRQLQRQVEAIAQGRFVPFPLPLRRDEVRELAVAINQLAQRLAEYDRQMRRHERLAAVATLGAGMAHQLRNAATGCRMAIDLHRRDCPAQQAAGTDDPLRVALRQLDQMESSIQRLLVLGRAQPDPHQPIELTEVAREAVDLVRPMAAHWGLTLDVSLPPSPLPAQGDRPALVHALVELLLNAMQATQRQKAENAPAGGSAPSSLSTIALRVEADSSAPQRCRFWVSDPGPGPAASMVAELFEPLTSDKPGGTGLGLAACRRIAEEHAGTLRFTRQADRTCFILEIATSQPSRTGQASPSAAVNSATKT